MDSSVCFKHLLIYRTIHLRQLIETRRRFTKSTKGSDAARTQAEKSGAKLCKLPETTVQQGISPSSSPPPISSQESVSKQSTGSRKRSIDQLDNDEQPSSPKVRLREDDMQIQNTSEDVQTATEEDETPRDSPELETAQPVDKQQDEEESSHSNQQKRKKRYPEDVEDMQEDDDDDDYGDDDEVQLVASSKHYIDDEPVEQPLSTSSELSRIYNLTRNMSPNRSFRASRYSISSSPRVSRSSLGGSNVLDILPQSLKTIPKDKQRESIAQPQQSHQHSASDTNEENKHVNDDGTQNEIKDTQEASQNLSNASNKTSPQKESTENDEKVKKNCTLLSSGIYLINFIL